MERSYLGNLHSMKFDESIKAKNRWTDGPFERRTHTQLNNFTTVAVAPPTPLTT